MPEARLRRSVHFVPGANEKMLQKSLALEADSLVLDLEDAVTPERKDSAREIVAGWLRDVDFGRQERMVRINPLATPWGFADLRACMVTPPDTFMVPKPRTLADLTAIDAEITRLENEYGHPAGGVGLLIVATETAEGTLNMATFTQCSRVRALSWGAEDLAADLGAIRNRDEQGQYLDVFKHCRIQTLLCAVAGDVQPIDTVFVDIRDSEGLRRESRDAAWMGFTGKITIHPDQVPIVNAAFTPSDEVVAEAEELLAAFAEAEAEGRMAFAFRGQMVDVPHLERAKRIVARSRAIRGS